MILDNVNPNDLFPTEKKGPSVLGIIEYKVQGENEFEGAFIATFEYHLKLYSELYSLRCIFMDKIKCILNRIISFLLIVHSTFLFIFKVEC